MHDLCFFITYSLFLFANTILYEPFYSAESPTCQYSRNGFTPSSVLGNKFRLPIFSKNNLKKIYVMDPFLVLHTKQGTSFPWNIHVGPHGYIFPGLFFCCKIWIHLIPFLRCKDIKPSDYFWPQCFGSNNDCTHHWLSRSSRSETE
jgi:hypothetical protein